ncbi:MAG: VTT domain-containing protein [bacterium]
MAESTTTVLRKYDGTITWVSLALIVLSLLLLARTLPISELVSAGAESIDRLGVWGPLVYGLLYIVATVLFVPGSIPTMAAGAIFGLLVGVITVSIASTMGAMLAFLIARYLAREKVAEVAGRRPKFDAVDRAVGEGGWKIVALLRLSPAVPFNLQNYLYGLTQIRFWPCLLATWLAMLPGTFLYIYIGHVAGAAIAGQRERSIWEWGMLILGLIATAAVTVYITVLAKRKLAEQTELEDQESEQPEPQEADRRPEPAPKSPWGAAAAAVLALLFLTAAVYAQWNTDRIEELLTGVFGPPQVELSEAYQETGTGGNFDHSTYEELLKEHVRQGGWIDYESLKQDGEQLDRYIEAINTARFDALGRDEKLALLINAYNAFTLKLILEHYPLDSIRDIPANERWEAARWQVGSHTWSLSQIEHEQIRPKFREPRIHFALVCAAVGCPPLRREAYKAERIEEQLEDQARYVHNHERWVRFEPEENRLHLTELYQWYKGDFKQMAGSLIEYVARHVPAVERRLAGDEKVSIEWIPYDWSLNSTENMP